MNCGIVLVLGLLTEFHLNRKTIKELLVEKKKLTKLNEEYKQLNQALTNTVHEKDDLILSFSHELKNPLNVISGNLELASMNCTEKAIIPLVKNAQSYTELLNLQINNLLDAGKLQNNKLEIVKDPTKLSSVVHHTWRTLKILTSRKNLKGQLFVDKSLPTMLSLDYHRLIQVVYNLVGNAVKFTATGGVTVILSWCPSTDTNDQLLSPSTETEFSKGLRAFSSIDCSPTTNDNASSTDEELSEHNDYSEVCYQYSLQTEYKSMNVLSATEKFYKIDIQNNFNEEIMVFNNMPSASHGYLKIEVRDTGVGLDSLEIPKLFQKFSQVGDNLHRQLGTGLGLWITKNLCISMGGNIKAYGCKNEGSTFVAVIETETLDSVASPHHVVSPKRIRALVVDDMKLNQDIHKCFLERCGVEIIDMASNGKEAYEIYKKRGNGYFNLIFMDLDMPVMNGEQASQKIREWEKYSHWCQSFLVIITGHCLKEDEKRLLDVKGRVYADHLFIKPFGIQSCINLINKLTVPKCY
jgi:signal transduction histidine kinase